jgi:hypothetical protein
LPFSTSIPTILVSNSHGLIMLLLIYLWVQEKTSFSSRRSAFETLPPLDPSRCRAFLVFISMNERRPLCLLFVVKSASSQLDCSLCLLLLFPSPVLIILSQFDLFHNNSFNCFKPLRVHFFFQLFSHVGTPLLIFFGGFQIHQLASSIQEHGHHAKTAVHISQQTDF